MHGITKAMAVVVLITPGLTPTAWVAEFSGVDNATAWTLKTGDTHLVLAVRDNKLFIEALKNPAQDWNWTPKPSPVPLLERVIVGNAPRPLTWNFREATTTDQAMYQGVCKAAMELVGKPMGRVREPMENLTPAEKKELRGIFKKMGAPVIMTCGSVR